MNWLIFLCAVCGMLFAAVCILTYKIFFMQKTAKELRISVAEKLHSDTNTLITVSTGDRAMRALANDLNRELSELHSQKRRFLKGDKEIQEAVTNISHDLRTPLTAISGYLELLEREENSEKEKRYLEAMENRVNAMKELTEELFRYSVILSDDKDKEWALEKLSLTGALEEALAGMYAAFINRGITPQITVPEETVFCMADKEALLRIISNILNNALKYSDGDLRICLTDNGQIRFTNSAVNLSNVDVGKLFDRFYTVDSSRTSTGLGLSIARHLAEKMGAEISAVYDMPEFTVILKMR